MGKKAKTVEAPDPTKVSAAQTQSNIDTARLNAKLNRVNQVTPYGSLTYSQGTPAGFDQAGYDKAMEAWKASNSGGQNANPNTTTYGTTETNWGQEQMSNGSSGTGGTSGSGGMPSRDQFNTPGSDEWTANITLSPEQQKLLDQDNRIKASLGNAAEQGIGRVTDTMGKPFDTSQFTQWGNIPQGGGAQNYNPQAQNYMRGIAGGNIQTSLPNSDYGAQRKSVEDAIYSRLNPQLERDRNTLDQKLANQGLQMGTEAYREAVDESNRQANDARMQAVLAGGQEQSRLAGLDLNAGQFANQAQAQGFGQNAANAALNNSVSDTMFNQGLQTQGFNNQANQQNFAQQIQSAQAGNAQRQQQLQEASHLRGLPMNELNALRTGSQVQNPQFTATPQTNVQGTDVSGNMWNAYNANVNNANASQAGNNSFLSGLFGLGSAAMGAPAGGFLSGLFK